MARNKITDLRDHLFAQLENLSDNEIMGNEEKAKAEIQRTKSIVSISKAIVETAKVEHDLLKLQSDGGYSFASSFIPQKSLE